MTFFALGFGPAGVRTAGGVGAAGEGLGFLAEARGGGWKGPLFGHSLLRQ
jgi:hypothetical protein